MSASKRMFVRLIGLVVLTFELAFIAALASTAGPDRLDPIARLNASTGLSPLHTIAGLNSLNIFVGLNTLDALARLDS